MEDVPEISEILSWHSFVSDGSPTSSMSSCPQSSQLLKGVSLVTLSLVTTHYLTVTPADRQVSLLSPLMGKSQILSWPRLSHALGQQGTYPWGRTGCSRGLRVFKCCNTRCPWHIQVFHLPSHAW